MSGLGTETNVKARHLVSFRMRSHKRRLTLDQLQDRLAELHDLLDLALALPSSGRTARNPSTSLARRSSVTGRFWGKRKNRLVVFPASSGEERQSSTRYVVRSVSYSSPLEIVIYIPPLMGGAYLSATRIIKLWEAWNVARRNHAKTKVAVAQSRVQESALGFIETQFMEQARRNPKKAASAARALLFLDEVKSIE